MVYSVYLPLVTHRCTRKNKLFLEEWHSLPDPFSVSLPYCRTTQDVMQGTAWKYAHGSQRTSRQQQASGAVQIQFQSCEKFLTKASGNN